jgi:pseudaminic acid cytidylyltransferase
MSLCIITARGGSKRIPRKNIKLFCGKPMIAYAIDVALTSGLFRHVVVSTDDGEIASVAKDHGAEVPFMRPQELADDHTGTVPVVTHAIRACADLGLVAELVCCIYPAVPLLQAQDLVSAAKLMEQTSADYVFPVAMFPSAVQRALKISAAGNVQPIYPEFENTRTQDLEPAYYDAGQFYFGRTEAWLADRSLHQNGKALIIPEWRVVDIDTPDDWARAELLFQFINRTETP